MCGVICNLMALAADYTESLIYVKNSLILLSLDVVMQNLFNDYLTNIQHN